MSDIVDRLRTSVHVHDGDLYLEAASEIERLRAQSTEATVRTIRDGNTEIDAGARTITESSTHSHRVWCPTGGIEEDNAGEFEAMDAADAAVDAAEAWYSQHVLCECEWPLEFIVDGEAVNVHITVEPTFHT